MQLNGSKQHWINAGVLCCFPFALALSSVAIAQVATAVTNKTKIESFREARSEWEKLRGELQAVANRAGGKISREEYEQLDHARVLLLRKMIALQPQVQELADAAWLEQTTADAELFRWHYGWMSLLMTSGRYLEANHIGTVLLKRESLLTVSQRSEVLRGAAWAAFNVNEFEASNGYSLSLQTLSPSDPTSANSLAKSRKYIAWWKVEQAIRRNEGMLNDLPRVRLVTNRGEIVLELFKKEAPNTVNEFLDLVKTQSFNDMAIDLIQVPEIRGIVVGSRTQQMKADNREGRQSNARLHFHGSVSVGKFDDSGVVKIAILNAPVGEFDGVNTVFGRVVDGMPEVEQIVRMIPVADKEKSIEKVKEATVLRK